MLFNWNAQYDVTGRTSGPLNEVTGLTSGPLNEVQNSSNREAVFNSFELDFGRVC